MDLRQLEYFVAVAEEQQFTRGAQRVNVAQPAVSQQIRRLEAELGEPLFRRGGRLAVLTQAGQELLPHARAALAAAERGRSAVASIRGGLHGELRIGLNRAPTDPRLPALLGEFNRLHPGIRIRISESHNEPLLAALASGALDAGIVALVGRAPESQRLRTRLISAVPVAVVVSASHPLAERRSVTVSSLDDQPLITLPRGSGLRALLDDAFGARGLMPRIVAEAHDLRLLIGLAAEGLGAALVPWTAAAAAVPGARVLALTRPRLEHRAAVAWNPGATSPAGRAFLRLAETHLVLTPGNDAPCTDGKPESGAARSHDGPD